MTRYAAHGVQRDVLNRYFIGSAPDRCDMHEDRQTTRAAR
jgi:hypothetical protein